MSNLIIDTVTKLSHFFIMTIVITIILGIILYYFSSKVSILKKTRNFCHIFYGLENRGKLLLAIYYLRILFLIYMIVSITTYTKLHYFVFFFLTLLIAILNFKKIINNLFDTFVLYMCLETTSIIIMYNTQIFYYSVLEGIYWLLGLFIVLFALYDFIRNLSQISKYRSDNFEKVKY